MAVDGENETRLEAAVIPIGSDTWHLANLVETAGQRTTLCGLVVYYGSRGLRWTDTPEDQRCRFCMRHLEV